jgi:hypothetical protein
VERQIKYVVQVQCRPAPFGLESVIVGFLSDYFSVTSCNVDKRGVSLEIISEHPIAYGSIKDLADLIVNVLSKNDVEFQQGVINRVEHWYAHLVDKIFNSETIANFVLTLGRSWTSIAGEAARNVVIRIFGRPRLVPEMYFHGDVLLDLMLTTRSNKTSINGVTESS